MRRDASSPVASVHAGRVRYVDAWAWQKDLVERRAADEVGDVLLTLEHDPVYTLGRRAEEANILLPRPLLEAQGFDVVEVDRGGDVTYHGPGQLVAYPILKLASTKGVVEYVRALETIGIAVCASYGLEAHAVEGYTGVWVGDAKVMAIGVRVSAHGVTQHGLAINVSTDLSHFANIVPCGITDKAVCSLVSLGIATDLAEATTRLRTAFSEVFAARLTDSDVASLGLPVPSDNDPTATPLPVRNSA